MQLRTWMVTAGLMLLAGHSTALAETLSMRFDVSVSGLQVMKVTFSGHVTAKEYAAEARVRPKGFVGIFMKKKLDMKVAGRFDGAVPQPKAFEYRSKKKKKKKQAQVRWQNGKVVHWQRSPAPGDSERQAIEQALKGVIDPLSALFALGRRNASAPCTGRFHVFDGLDVYDLKLVQEGRSRISTGAYAGPVTKCRMIYVPIAGMSEDKKRRQLQDPPVFTLWLARVKSAELGPVWVPVQAKGRTKGKPFSATLVKGRLGSAGLQPAL